MATSESPRLPSAVGEPTWEAAYFFPLQGQWHEDDFLRFHTNRMAELVDGRLELLPMPTLKHQRMLIWLLDLFRVAIVDQKNAMVLIAPLPIKLFPGTIREPDLLYIAPENSPDEGVDYPIHIDLALEIVSEGTEARKRDYGDKRHDYAQAGVSEYWIVDPQDECVTVFTLDRHAMTFRIHGVFHRKDFANSLLLQKLNVCVDELFAA